MYNDEKPYAITSITPYGTEVPLREQQITYNALRRPETITENGYVATFTYNGEGNRVKMNLKKNNQVQLNKYYWGNMNSRQELRVQKKFCTLAAMHIQRQQCM